MKRTPGFSTLGTSLAVALVLLLVAAVPSLAQPNDRIYAGNDVWYTPSGGAELTVTIPGGTFCGPNSPTLTRFIRLEGVPLATTPQLTDVDTVILRPNDSPLFDSAGNASTSLQIIALNLRSVNNFSVNCGTHTELWKTRVKLAPVQAPGTIDFVKTSSTGGTFTASFPVAGEITYINAANSNDTRGPFNDNQVVTTVSSPFTFAPGPDSQPTGGPFSVDADVDGIVELHTGLPTGPNFWAGNIEHEGPHPETCAAPGQGCPEWEPQRCDDPVVVNHLKTSAVKGLGFVFEEQEAEAREAGVIGKAVVVTQVDSAQLQKNVRDICVEVVGAQYLR